MRWPWANRSNPSITHSWARTISWRSLFLQNSMTLSGWRTQNDCQKSITAKCVGALEGPNKWAISKTLCRYSRRMSILLTPKVTNPGPRAFGRKPSTLSFSVGSDLHKRKIQMIVSDAWSQFTQLDRVHIQCINRNCRPTSNSGHLGGCALCNPHTDQIGSLELMPIPQATWCVWYYIVISAIVSAV